MQETLSALLGELHTLYFKPSGFTKKRNRFRRQIELAIQEIEFQSSQWNSSGEPIVFYVNVRCGFSDIIMGEGKAELPGSGRIGGLARNAPPDFHLSITNHAAIRDQLIELIPEALVELPKHYEDVRTRAKTGFQTPIPLPETWRA